MNYQQNVLSKSDTKGVLEDGKSPKVRFMGYKTSNQNSMESLHDDD